MALKRLDHVRWMLEKDFKAGMRVTGLIYGDSYIIQGLEEEGALEQVVNVACLPGIFKHSYAMPDIHWGYGFSYRWSCSLFYGRGNYFPWEGLVTTYPAALGGC